MKRVFIIGTVLAALLAPCASLAKSTDNLGIAISTCGVNEKDNLTNGVNVVYYSSHATPVVEVEFAVKYKKKTYTMIDRGTFTQGAQINHNLTNALVGEVWEGPNPGMCTVKRVLLANGKELE